MDDLYSSADRPKTDRELLLIISGDMRQVREQIVGVCTQQKDQNDRINRLENWRWYLIGGISIVTFLLVLFGRYIDLGGQV